tara:strand:- start:334 stop:1032 length:699 start_codon:yes stop_codon:yes gene_type:complete
MIYFYKISTTDFQPISHNEIYLYREYNKIRDFLISNNQTLLLKVLAIPSYKNRNIVWSADTNNEVKKLDQFYQSQQDNILSKYNDFLNSYNSFVDNLRSSMNQDNKNWGNLLHSLIEGSANELFFDGDDIFITWGWRLLDENSKKLIPVYSSQPLINNDLTPKIDDEGVSETIQNLDQNKDNLIEEQEVIKDDFEKRTEKLSWLDRLYIFLIRKWWLIPFLSFCILLLLILR